jgi:hypothetical protein
MWIVRVERVTAGETELLPITSRAGGAKAPIEIAPDPTGHPVGVTIAVGADVACPAPLEFRAVTVTRSVWPTSVELTVYTLVEAPIAAHAFPLVSQRLHAKENVFGALFQVPRWAVSCCPASGVPVIVGNVLFVGTALVEAWPLPGCPKMAPSNTPAKTASKIPSLVRVRCMRSMADPSRESMLRFARAFVPGPKAAATPLFRDFS